MHAYASKSSWLHYGFTRRRTAGLRMQKEGFERYVVHWPIHLSVLGPRTHSRGGGGFVRAQGLTYVSSWLTSPALHWSYQHTPVVCAGSSLHYLALWWSLRHHASWHATRRSRDVQVGCTLEHLCDRWTFEHELYITSQVTSAWTGVISQQLTSCVQQ